ASEHQEKIITKSEEIIFCVRYADLFLKPYGESLFLSVTHLTPCHAVHRVVNHTVSWCYL
ncbi:hypothetical protein ACRW5F_28930, partial [Escherichia coli]